MSYAALPTVRRFDQFGCVPFDRSLDATIGQYRPRGSTARRRTRCHRQHGVLLPVAPQGRLQQGEPAIGEIAGLHIMDVKEAVAKARAFAQEAFGADDLGFIRLEEIDHDDVARDWLITLGLYRPAVASRGQQLASLMGNAELKRSYRVFRVSETTGDVKSVKIREFQEQE